MVERKSIRICSDDDHHQDLMDKLDKLTEEKERNGSTAALIAIKEYLEEYWEDNDLGDKASPSLNEAGDVKSSEEKHLQNLREATRLQSEDLLNKEEERRKAKQKHIKELEKEYLKQV